MDNSTWEQKYDSVARVMARIWHLKTGLDFDDLYSVAYVTILEARQTFDGGKGASEKTYLKAAIKKAFIDYTTKEYQYRYTEEIDPEHIDYHTSNPEEELIAQDLKEKLKLSEDDLELLEMRNEGCTDKEIAEHQNKTQQAVHKRRKKIQQRIDDLVLKEN